MLKIEFIISTLLSFFVVKVLFPFTAGFLEGLGFYKIKKKSENVKYTADKEVKKTAPELEKEKVNLTQLEIKEGILNSSQKVYEFADKHKEKISHDLNTKNIIASNIKINDYKNNIKPEGLMPELEQKDSYSDQLENDDLMSPK